MKLHLNSIKLKSPSINLGTIYVTSKCDDPFSLVVVLEKKNDGNDDDYDKYLNYVALEVGIHTAEFKIKIGGEKHTLLKETGDVGLDKGVTQTYWFSYDRDGKVIKYGKGHAMEETTLLMYDFKKSYDSKTTIFFDIHPSTKSSILLYSSATKIIENTVDKTTVGSIDFEPWIYVTGEPLIFTPSPSLKEFELTVQDLINPEHTHPNRLPSECKKIYDDIKNIQVLDPMLIAPIRNSIQTEGFILNKILKQKAYLRITLGENVGNSPGCPNVLEIWPAGAESPIHNHGRCSAVIKVLHGSIQCRIFNKITNPPAKNPTPIKDFTASKGDYTWMNEQWFQTHQLRNISDDYCATLQCYQYAPEDGTHYPMFNYKAGVEYSGFQPGSDLPFEKMKEMVLQEWANGLLAQENHSLQEEIADKLRKLKTMEDENKHLKNENIRLKVAEDENKHLKNENIRLKTAEDENMHLKNENIRLKIAEDENKHLKNENIRLQNAENENKHLKNENIILKIAELHVKAIRTVALWVGEGALRLRN